MNPSEIMRIRIDYINNNIDSEPQEYRQVIASLVMELERLNARHSADTAIINSLRSK